MYKKILVPLDGSERAEQILPHVEAMAEMNQSEVIFLRVVRPTVISVGYKGILVDESREEGQRQVAEALSYLSGIESRCREKGIETRKTSEIGAVVSTIIKVAQEEAVDLIAMASHGRGGLSRVFYGSVAAGVLQVVDRPLLLIRSRIMD
jgi:nucleotide-binding universal stress UspA family protein